MKVFKVGYHNCNENKPFVHYTFVKADYLPEAKTVFFKKFSCYIYKIDSVHYATKFDIFHQHELIDAAREKCIEEARYGNLAAKLKLKQLNKANRDMLDMFNIVCEAV